MLTINYNPKSQDHSHWRLRSSNVINQSSSMRSITEYSLPSLEPCLSQILIRNRNWIANHKIVQISSHKPSNHNSKLPKINPQVDPKLHEISCEPNIEILNLYFISQSSYAQLHMFQHNYDVPHLILTSTRFRIAKNHNHRWPEHPFLSKQTKQWYQHDQHFIFHRSLLYRPFNYLV